MDLVIYLALLALWGLVVGAFARFALPGRDALALWQTALVGVAGSVLAAIASLLLFGQLEGFLLCLVFATAIMYLVRRSRGGGLVDPGVRAQER
jgi:uncharacterized membrane protein YeaQ/YmgE (transglycosylase-associated protein family)